MAQRELSYDDFGVAIICPLEVEVSAVRYMMEVEYDRLPQPPGDSNRYIYGELSGHKVVIAYLPQGSQGIGAAAVVATDMKRTFPHITLRFLVGIGGGVPSQEKDIRLGDVVVSMPTGVHGGVMQYDLGKDTIQGFERKGYLEQPPTILRNCVVEMQSDHRLKQSRISLFVETLIKRSPDLAQYGRPDATRDILFLPTNTHIAGEATCERCDHTKLVRRPTRTTPMPRIHYGLIASGNRVEKNAELRDKLAQDAGGALCFEMEAAGLMNDFRCIVIRGISDYADSHKNDGWHAYAAATAAGCVKEMLSYIEPITVTRKPNLNKHWTIDRVMNPHFTGRTEETAKIVAQILHALQDGERTEQCRIVLTGMGGQGKSEICLRVANQTRSSFWGVFWVDVSTSASIESDFFMIASRLNQSASKPKEVCQSLSNIQQPWLLILDNADDVDIDYQQYIPGGTLGVVMLTSRNRECQQYVNQLALSLDGLPPDDACALLSKIVQSSLRGQPQLEEQDEGSRQRLHSVAIGLLHGHPLALMQAGAYITRGHCSIEQYPLAFEKQRKRLLTFHPKQAQSRYQNVYATFEASAEMLKFSPDETATDALELLSFLSMLASSPLPLVIFEVIWNGAQDIKRDPESNDIGSTKITMLNVWHVEQLLPLLDISTEA